MSSASQLYLGPSLSLLTPASLARWTYVRADAPKYFTGHTINLSGQIAVFFLTIFGIFYCIRENKLREAGKRDHRLEGLSDDEADHLGYRHPRFRYIT